MGFSTKITEIQSSRYGQLFEYVPAKEKKPIEQLIQLSSELFTKDGHVDQVCLANYLSRQFDFMPETVAAFIRGEITENLLIELSLAWVANNDVWGTGILWAAQINQDTSAHCISFNPLEEEKRSSNEQAAFELVKHYLLQTARYINLITSENAAQATIQDSTFQAEIEDKLKELWQEKPHSCRVTMIEVPEKFQEQHQLYKKLIEGSSYRAIRRLKKTVVEGLGLNRFEKRLAPLSDLYDFQGKSVILIPSMDIYNVQYKLNVMPSLKERLSSAYYHYEARIGALPPEAIIKCFLKRKRVISIPMGSMLVQCAHQQMTGMWSVLIHDLDHSTTTHMLITNLPTLHQFWSTLIEEILKAIGHEMTPLAYRIADDTAEKVDILKLMFSNEECLPMVEDTACFTENFIPIGDEPSDLEYRLLVAVMFMRDKENVFSNALSQFKRPSFFNNGIEDEQYLLTLRRKLVTHLTDDLENIEAFCQQDATRTYSDSLLVFLFLMKINLEIENTELIEIGDRLHYLESIGAVELKWNQRHGIKLEIGNKSFRFASASDDDDRRLTYRYPARGKSIVFIKKPDSDSNYTKLMKAISNAYLAVCVDSVSAKWINRFGIHPASIPMNSDPTSESVQIHPATIKLT